MKKTLSCIICWNHSCQHLYEKCSKAEDVHLGGLLVGVVGFRGSIAGVARTDGMQLLKEVDCAVVRHFGTPVIIGQRCKEDIGTTDVAVNERVWSHEVEVVEGSGHIKTDHDGLIWRHWLSLQLLPQTGGHQLCQDHHLSFQGGSNECQQVGVAYSGGHVHLSFEQLDVVV